MSLSNGYRDLGEHLNHPLKFSAPGGGVMDKTNTITKNYEVIFWNLLSRCYDVVLVCLFCFLFGQGIMWYLNSCMVWLCAIYAILTSLPFSLSLNIVFDCPFSPTWFRCNDVLEREGQVTGRTDSKRGSSLLLEKSYVVYDVNGGYDGTSFGYLVSWKWWAQKRDTTSSKTTKIEFMIFIYVHV